MRDGQAIDINDPQMTLTGKRGTLVVRNRIEWSTSRTAGRSSPAPGRSSVARATTPGSPEADDGPAPTAREVPVRRLPTGTGQMAGRRLRQLEIATSRIRHSTERRRHEVVDSSDEDGARPRGHRRSGRDGVAVGASANRPKPVVIPPDAVLTWNTYTVNAVRASTPTKVQTDGMVYMSYVQAAVYDAVTKLQGRYEPYHDFAVAVVPGASVQAAVAAAARGRRSTTTCPTSRRPSMPSTRRTSQRSPEASLTASRSARRRRTTSSRSAPGDGLNAATPSYGGIGPILPGQWQLQPGQAVQTPWFATMRPFLLDRASQFRAEPPPALTSRPVREGPERDRGLRCAQQHRPHAGADGDCVLLGREQHQPVQRDDAEPSSRSTAWISSTPRICSRWATSSRPTRGWPASTRSSSTSSGGRSRRSGTPTRTAIPTRRPTRPGRRCWGCRATPNIRPSTAASRPPSATRSRPRCTRSTSTSTMPGGAERKQRPHDDSQHFNTVDDMQEQVVDARVWLGFHFRNSVEQGEKLGNNVAKWELKRYFKRVQHVTRSSPQRVARLRAGHSPFKTIQPASTAGAGLPGVLRRAVAGRDYPKKSHPLARRRRGGCVGPIYTSVRSAPCQRKISA